jgi:hypothetical protein
MMAIEITTAEKTGVNTTQLRPRSKRIDQSPPFVAKTNINNTQKYHLVFVTAMKGWKIRFRFDGTQSSSVVRRIEQTSGMKFANDLCNQIRRVVDTDGIRHYRPVFSINETSWWRHRG